MIMIDYLQLMQLQRVRTALEKSLKYLVH
jgi:hypothetical protein